MELRFPVREIVGFITGWVNEKDMQDLMIERHRRISERINMINYANSITKTVTGTLLEKYVLGIVLSNLKEGAQSNINGTSEETRKLLQAAINDYQANLQGIYDYREKKLPFTLSEFQA